jgi:hypothetical protein
MYVCGYVSTTVCVEQLIDNNWLHMYEFGEDHTAIQHLIKTLWHLDEYVQPRTPAINSDSDLEPTDNQTYFLPTSIAKLWCC